MAYIVNAADPSRPLDTDPRKQGAEELRALKLRVNQLQSTLEGADSTNAAAAAAATAAAVAAASAAQDTANSAGSAASAAQDTANSAAGAAALAQSSADTALATAALAATALSGIKIKAIQHIASGSGNVTVPERSTKCLAIGKGGDQLGYSSSEFSTGIASGAAATNAAIVAVTGGASVAYSIGVGSTTPTATTFGGAVYAAAPPTHNNSGATNGWPVSNGWLVLVFY